MNTPSVSHGDGAATPCRPAPPSAVLAAAPVPPGPLRRRRLWQLPTQAHELLLATGFSPDDLRRETARTLSRMHQAVCKLQGSDVDVLYSVLQDLGTRNPLSEALHRRLDERHAQCLRRVAGLREPEGLRTAWTQALADHEMPGGLWALLTHPLGAKLEVPALYDARGWVFAHCRRSVDQSRAQVAARGDERKMRQQVDDLRLRLARQQHDAAASLAHAQAELARLRGEVARLSALPAANGLPEGIRSDIASPQTANAEQATERIAPRIRRAPPPKANTSGLLAAVSLQGAAAPAARSAPRSVHPVQGRRVLCVGGIQHAVSQYRNRIERMGGHFDHHDGGVEDSVHGLDGRLQRAELVICQAACINHEAYQRIKRHCERTGKPCMYLARPSLSRFVRALHEMADSTDDAVQRHAD